ncbi:O-antigen ligase family protein [Flavobacterium sp. J27]|uniref:O-antigen ligase family protein n=1 Tax=Flavobacterium sp. J27 TaxID=2060419 RepID=UPI0013EE4205|nr:O-antigen ligase family protein [Flavobacterium sp. J27]
MILLSQIYIPSFKINIFFQLFVLVFYFSIEKESLSIRLIKTITPLIVIFILGFIGFILYKNPLGYALKDIFHFIKPIQGILIGYFLFKVINDKKIFIKTIIQTGFISAIIHFLILIIFVDLSSGSISVIRQFTRDNFLELFALFFLAYNQFFYHENVFSSKKKSRIIFAVIFTSSVLYFSRTMMVGALILFLSIHGYTKINQKSIKIILIIFISILSLYGYLYSVKIDRGKPGLEAFLYKIKIAPEELFKTKIDREDHKDLWDHWRGYEAKRSFALMEKHPFSIVSGTGYGSLVNLKFYAPLSSDKKGLKFISELHNGYPYVLYKMGIIGLLFYLFFLIRLYSKVYKKFSFENVFTSAIGIYYLFSTLTITGLYNTSDTIIFVLGALIFVAEEKQKREKHD